MQSNSGGLDHGFNKSLHQLKESTSLTHKKALQKVLSQADGLLGKPNGIQTLYNKMPELMAQGLFDNTPWKDFDNLVPSLTSGTLKSGFPNNVYEMLSNLRVLALVNGHLPSDVSKQEAGNFLESVLVQNLDLIFNHLSEADRLKMTKTETDKLQAFFGFVLDHLSIDGIKDSLGIELDHLIAQRPIDTYKIRELIDLITDKIDLNKKDKSTKKLNTYINAVKIPSPLSLLPDYYLALANASEETLILEAECFGDKLIKFGLASKFQAQFVEYNIDKRPDLIARSLGLTSSGKAEWEKHQWFLQKLIKKTIEPSTRQGIYGLRELLERNLLSRSAVYNGIKALMSIKVNPEIKRKLAKSHWSAEGTPALKTLLAGTLCILGQPLGIGQGLNPTCQSARGISLWSEHAPAKLINMIITVAEYNNIEFRFEGLIIESMKVAEGLTKTFDFTLDPVSIVLVPHLDRIYMEMMKKASLRAEDPHKWVNPAMYGHWIPTGFASTYNYLTGTIHQYTLFMRHFIAAFHPKYNGNRKLIYPVPVGIYITSSKGDMLGFHAVSILRVDWSPDRSHRRIFFLNPNNEGRQNWGQEIKPKVHKNGERPGESSLPFDEFASRVYAFHYPSMGVEGRLQSIDNVTLEKITALAKESWGKSYSWTN